MATKQQPKKSTASRSTANRAKPAPRAPQKARPAAPPPPTMTDRVLDSLAVVFDGHGHDVWGVGLVAVAVVSAFGIYGHAAGPVGTGAAALFGAIFGLTRYLVPPALVAIAVVLIRGPRVERPVADDILADEGSVATRNTRRIAGAVVVLLAVTGLLHLIVAPPTIASGGLDAYSDAGGYLGGATGGGLGGLIGTWGAGSVLVLLLALGATLLAGLPFRELAPMIRRALTPAVNGGGRSLSNLFRVGDAEDDPDSVPLFDYNADPSDPLARRSRSPRKKPSAPAEPTIVLPEVTVPTSVEQLEIQLDPQRPGSPWKLPSLSLLSRSKAQTHDTEAITARGRQLEGALAEHGVTTRLSGMVVGPTVTRYELELGVGVKVNQVVNLSKDIAYAMASPDVRIIAPIPGKQAIGVEVPNQKRQVIALGDILCSTEAQKSKAPLSVAVGRDIEGKTVMVDLAKMPHILIAGQTGAGKSSC
ncbi:MAG: DNA translocase FtsK 4TM domain-containing protein, partial [Acidimicrobiales bacterium]